MAISIYENNIIVMDSIKYNITVTIQLYVIVSVSHAPMRIWAVETAAGPNLVLNTKL